MAFSRRRFLKGLVATGAVTTAAPVAAATKPIIPHERQQPPKVARTVTTTCGICFWKCGVTAEIGEDGTLLHLKGIKGHPLSRGKLCPRGVGGIGLHEDPDRLKYPMIRTGKRGEGVFRRVSWEEALSEIGDRLGRVIDKDGPGTLGIMTHGSSEAHFGYLANAMGTPHHSHPAYDQCKGPREVGFKLTFGNLLKSPEPLDIENTGCLVLLGSHLGENMHNLQVQEMVTARSRGAKLIVVDPRRSTAGEKADMWLPIRPGSDIALLLAWTHILIRDGLIDRNFVDQYCDGYDQLAQHVKTATPEWASRETDLSIQQIEKSGRLIGLAAPHVCIHPGRHVVWYGDDTQRSRAVAILVAITGAWGTRGGYYLPHKVKLPLIEEAFPDIPACPKKAERRDPGYPFGVGVNVNGMREATRDGKIKAWIVAGTNLITTLPAQHETLEAIKKLDTLVVIDVLPTEITQYADILLPAASYLERDDLFTASQSRDPFVGITQKAAEEIGESHCECSMAYLIGKSLGLGHYWTWKSVKEYQDAVIAAYNAKHPEAPIDIAQLRKDGFVAFSNAGPIYRAGHGLGPDGSGRAGRKLEFPHFDNAKGDNRVHLFSHELDAMWQEKTKKGEDPTGYEPLPTYYRQPGPPPGHVRLVYGRSPVHSFGRTQNNPVLSGRESENSVWVAPAVAEVFGVENAEYVEMINQDGVRAGPVRLKVTSRIRDDAVYMTHGHGHNSRLLTRAWKKGADDSALMTRYKLDPLSGGTGMRVNFVRLVRPHAV